MKLFKSNSKKVRGQGMSEYLIIVALIAVAGIAVMGLFGRAAQNQVAGMAAEIAGGDAQQQITDTTTAAGNAATEANQKNTLSDYNGQAAAINN